MPPSSKVLVILLSDALPRRSWLYDAGIPQKIYARFSSAYPVEWHVMEPSQTYPYVEHRHYVPIGLKEELLELVIAPLRKVRQLFKSNWRAKFLAGSKQITPCERSVSLLYNRAKEVGVDYLAFVSDDSVAVFPEALDFGLKVVLEEQADLFYTSKIKGMLPVIVSTRLFENWLSGEAHPNARQLLTPQVLGHLGKTVDFELLPDKSFQGQVRCTPQDTQEKWMLDYWEKQTVELKSAFVQTQENLSKGQESLKMIVSEYRSQFAPGLETYHLVGTLHDIENLRQRMMTTKKPLPDYFVAATHYGRFLQKYAGLNRNSHVVDIGCSWGYLGFALANLLNEEGAYLGIEIQPEATAWSNQHLDWLGPNFQFKHLDVYNDYYNPDGTTPRNQVALPVADGWANVIILGSVFTHMQEDGVQNYLDEFYRILAPGGIVGFSYDDSSYWGHGEEYVIGDVKVPDKTTIYSRTKIKQMVEKAGLKTAREPVNMLQFDRTDYQTWYFAER